MVMQTNPFMCRRVEQNDTHHTRFGIVGHYAITLLRRDVCIFVSVASAHNICSANKSCSFLGVANDDRHNKKVDCRPTKPTVSQCAFVVTRRSELDKTPHAPICMQTISFDAIGVEGALCVHQSPVRRRSSIRQRRISDANQCRHRDTLNHVANEPGVRTFRDAETIFSEPSITHSFVSRNRIPTSCGQCEMIHGGNSRAHGVLQLDIV